MGFKERFEALGDIEELLKVAAPQYRSPKAYYEELIEKEEDKNLAEKRLRILEDLLAKNEEDKIRLKLERVIRERNELLRNTDWTQLPDVPLSQEDKKLYRKYREFLRNLPEDVKKGRLPAESKDYDEWLKWVDQVKYKPGFKKYIP